MRVAGPGIFDPVLRQNSKRHMKTCDPNLVQLIQFLSRIESPFRVLLNRGDEAIMTTGRNLRHQDTPPIS
jgi:hypothetical protein